MTWLVALLGAGALVSLYDGLVSPKLHSLGDEERRRRTMETARSAARGVAAGSIGLLLAAAVTGSFPLACMCGFAAGIFPMSLRRNRRRRAARVAREEWPDALAELISAVQAGMSLPEACCSMAQRAGEGLEPGARAFLDTYGASGSLSQALVSLRAQAADPMADRIVLALELAHDVGGSDLVRVLRALSELVHEDIRVRKEIEARWSWNITAARLAAAAPAIVLALMTIRPEGVEAFSSPEGLIVIGVGAALAVLGYSIMLRIGRLPEDRRLS